MLDKHLTARVAKNFIVITTMVIQQLYNSGHRVTSSGDMFSVTHRHTLPGICHAIRDRLEIDYINSQWFNDAKCIYHTTCAAELS